MTQNRLLSDRERERILATVAPRGEFKPPRERKPFGIQATPWEDQLGDLNEWRENVGMGRAILPILASTAKTQSVQNSILNRLRKLFPKESWTTYVEGKEIFLRFNGPKRSYVERRSQVEVRDTTEDDLFAQAS